MAVSQAAELLVRCGDKVLGTHRVALYARVSTESQQARGTIGSQLAVLRDRVGAQGCVDR